MNTKQCTAFAEESKIAQGTIQEVAIQVKEYLQGHENIPILIFDNLTSHVIDLDLRGTIENIRERYTHQPKQESEAKSGPGRPKLGVIAREVTLLPRHWDWLSRQPGGASVTLRKLVEEAKTRNLEKDQIRLAQEATHRFMTAMAGNLPGYEEALRALYSKNYDEFLNLIKQWPRDLQDHVRVLASAAIAEALPIS